jgi:hypothetical protein
MAIRAPPLVVSGFPLSSYEFIRDYACSVKEEKRGSGGPGGRSKLSIAFSLVLKYNGAALYIFPFPQEKKGGDKEVFR